MTTPTPPAACQCSCGCEKGPPDPNVYEFICQPCNDARRAWLTLRTIGIESLRPTVGLHRLPYDHFYQEARAIARLLAAARQFQWDNYEITNYVTCDEVTIYGVYGVADLIDAIAELRAAEVETAKP